MRVTISSTCLNLQQLAFSNSENTEFSWTSMCVGVSYLTYLNSLISCACLYRKASSDFMPSQNETTL
jgi:hypothetical protein